MRSIGVCTLNKTFSQHSNQILSAISKRKSKRYLMKPTHYQSVHTFIYVYIITLCGRLGMSPFFKVFDFLKPVQTLYLVLYFRSYKMHVM